MCTPLKMKCRHTGFQQTADTNSFDSSSRFSLSLNKKINPQLSQNNKQTNKQQTTNNNNTSIKAITVVKTS